MGLVGAVVLEVGRMGAGRGGGSGRGERTEDIDEEDGEAGGH